MIRHRSVGTLIAVSLSSLTLSSGCANDAASGDHTLSSDRTGVSTSTFAPRGDALTPTSITLRLTEVAKLDAPVDIVPRAGTKKLYVAEKGGTVVALTPRSGRFEVNGVAVLDVTDALGDAGTEQGLLGIAFSNDGTRLFVNHTDGDDDGATVIEAFNMNGDIADTTSRVELLRVKQPFENHNGGNVVVGSNDLLYVGMGDGGSQGDPDNNGQNPSTLLGSMVEIDPISGTNKVVAIGLRNPWRYSFDRSTGDLWIGDVGASGWEEIDHLPAEAIASTTTDRLLPNFGWSLREGRHDTEKADDARATGTFPSNLIDPVFEYSHEEGSSITGGFVYRGSKIRALEGVYLFADFSTAELRGLRADGSLGVVDINTEGSKLSAVSSFGQDDEGELYAVSLEGQILRIERG